MRYWIEEEPKKCPTCNNTSSKVRQSYKVDKPRPATKRKRICSNCGGEYETITPIDRRFI